MSVTQRGRKAKGDKAEREVLTLLRDHLGSHLVRARLEGDNDHGDITGVDEVAVQVKNYRDVTRGIREGLLGVAEQKVNAGLPFGAVFSRRPGGNYVVTMTALDWIGLYREAVFGREK